MDKKIACPLASRDEALEQEGREMCRTVIADTVTDLLADYTTVNAYMLRQGIEAQITPMISSYRRGQLLGARDVIDGLRAQK